MYHLDLDGGVIAAASPIRGVEVVDPKSFMDDLRAEVPDVVIQGFDARYVAGLEHLWAVVRQAWMADRRGVSKVKFDLDILLRVACDSRLAHALKTVGLKKGVLDVIFVAVGPEENLRPAAEVLGKRGSLSDSLFDITPEKEAFLLRYHGLGDLALESTLLRHDQLASILAEKAAVTLSGKH